MECDDDRLKQVTGQMLCTAKSAGARRDANDFINNINHHSGRQTAPVRLDEVGATSGFNRRRSLQSAAATGSLLACYGIIDRTSYAAPLRISPPIVEKLTIQVVLDSNHDAYISGEQVPGLGVTRVRTPAAFNGRTLESQWGLSLYLTSTKGTEIKRILLDFGFTPDVLNNNLELLRLDVPGIDALILSHGHQDHFGGMLGFLAHHRDQMKPDLRLVHGRRRCILLPRAEAG